MSGWVCSHSQVSRVTPSTAPLNEPQKKTPEVCSTRRNGPINLSRHTPPTHAATEGFKNFRRAPLFRKVVNLNAECQGTERMTVSYRRHFCQKSINIRQTRPSSRCKSLPPLVHTRFQRSRSRTCSRPSRFQYYCSVTPASAIRHVNPTS